MNVLFLLYLLTAAKLRNFKSFRYKTFEVGTYATEDLFSINVNCKFPVFTKNVNI